MKPYYKIRWACALVALAEFNEAPNRMQFFPTGWMHQKYETWLNADSPEECPYRGKTEKQKRVIRSQYAEQDDKTYTQILALINEAGRNGWKTPRGNKTQALKLHATYSLDYYHHGEPNAPRPSRIIEEYKLATAQQQDAQQRTISAFKSRDVQHTIVLRHPELDHIYRRLHLCGTLGGRERMNIASEEHRGNRRARVTLVPTSRADCQHLIDWLTDYADKYYPRTGRPRADADDLLDQANELLDELDGEQDDTQLDVDL
jgi:hypothetical protein